MRHHLTKCPGMKPSRTFVVLFMLFLAVLAHAESRQVVVSTNNTPLDRKALELLTQEVARRTGIEFKIVSHPSERSLHMANQGEVDGEGLRVAGLGSQYPNLVQVPERFIGISFVAFSKDAMINLDRGWESLKPYRVSFITGWKMFEANAIGAKVVQQNAQVTAFNGSKLPLRNIIASWKPEERERVLLLAHYDTRPFADKDDERTNEPIPGANDGGSGVGILLEIARHLATKQHGPGVDILLTDVEDYGQPSGAMSADANSIDTWALGSQYFSKNPHVAGYSARFGILLDMCGAKDARFYREAISMRYAPAVVGRIWKTGAALGHGDRFVQETKYFVGTDDHLPINERLRIPTADIIEYNAGTGAFHASWHTHDDDMDVIDRTTLGIVGSTVLEVVWQER